MINPYALLKIPADATIREVDAAYERLFDRYEPQAQAGDAAAIAMLNELNEAYDLLTNPAKRAEVDSKLGDGSTPARTLPRKPYQTPARQASARAQARFRASQPIPARRGAMRVGQSGRARGLSGAGERFRLPLVPLLLLGLLAFGLAAAISYMVISNSGAQAENRGTVVATVNGEPIYEQDFLERAEVDKQGALQDPIFGGYIKTLAPISQTQALETLRSDSLDRLVNFEVLNQQARKEGLYPDTPAKQRSVIEDVKSRELKGMNFADFLKKNNLTEGQYNRRVIRNVVYSLMANAHTPVSGTAEERRSAFFQWICQTRKSYDVKILITFKVSNPPCTSDLPPELPLPGVDVTVPTAEATSVAPTAPRGTPLPKGTQGPPEPPPK